MISYGRIVIASVDGTFVSQNAYLDPITKTIVF